MKSYTSNILKPLSYIVFVIACFSMLATSSLQKRYIYPENVFPTELSMNELLFKIESSIESNNVIINSRKMLNDTTFFYSTTLDDDDVHGMVNLIVVYSPSAKNLFIKELMIKKYRAVYGEIIDEAITRNYFDPILKAANEN